ncbi:cysteine-rich CWC family protein [Paenibacillus sinopodophylli]|uniref:cysteine-rich CWC family protein n=1 Tax=Paenibacillus sinopodophylli TaxID=1837342 RepID=UPI00110CBB7C|nr:cysteine-rich CWC family protein [Paenibacillus sinopodophylli]
MQCPLCNEVPDCAVEAGREAGSCWCVQRVFPNALLDSVPAELKHKACICQKCVDQWYRDNE